MIGSTCNSKTESFFRDLIVPAGFAVGMQKDVRMRVDQSGHEGHARQVNNSCVRGRFHFTRWADRFDLLATNQNNPIPVGFKRLAIEDASGFRGKQFMG